MFAHGITLELGRRGTIARVSLVEWKALHYNAFHMNRRLAVREHVVPGWHELIAQVSPQRNLTLGLAGMRKIVTSSKERATLPHSAEITYARSILRFEGGQPTPRIAWNLAAMLRESRAGLEWCAGPLFLFAAGHFHLYAMLILRAGKLITLDRKIQLVKATVGACQIPMSPDDGLRARLETIGNTDWSPKIKMKAIRRILRELGDLQPQPEHDIWKLSAEEWGEFEHSFEKIENDKKPDDLLNSGSIRSSAELASTLAAMHPEAGLQQVRELTIWATTCALNSKTA